MNRTELAKSFGVSLTSIDNWIRRGCPHSKEGRNLNFELEQVLQWRSRQISFESGSGGGELPPGGTGNMIRDFTNTGLEQLSRYLISQLGPAWSGLLAENTSLSPAIIRALYVGTASIVRFYIFKFIEDDEFGQGFKRLMGLDLDVFYQQITPRAEIKSFNFSEWEKQTDSSENIRPIFEEMKKKGDFNDPTVRKILAGVIPGFEEMFKKDRKQKEKAK